MGEVDYSDGKYGDLPLNQSQAKTSRVLTRVSEIGLHIPEVESTWVRARLHTSRAKGKQCFVVLRQGTSTVQGILAVSPDGISKQMLKFVSK